MTENTDILNEEELSALLSSRKKLFATNIIARLLLPKLILSDWKV